MNSNAFEIDDLNHEQFLKFSKLIHEKSSITLKDHKVILLSNRIRRRLHDLTIRDYDTYYEYLTLEKNEQEMTLFLNVITTNETFFWRTTQNFDLLKTTILPELLEKFNKQILNFWSAGCSSGEESYNLAIELTEGMKKNGSFDFKIKGSDLSDKMIQLAKQGQYSGRKIDRVPEPILRRYFNENPATKGEYIVRDDIKKRITFKVENLFSSLENSNSFHCIFCRNVMIYFKKEDQILLINKFFEALLPGGFLVIGHSESLHMLDIQFKSRQTEAGVVYYK